MNYKIVRNLASEISFEKKKIHGGIKKITGLLV